ncbi:MAG: N-acetylmuramoyl-L-alanine amidase [Humidesulfovibrio sp.]|nr:N-acetylmuramoyl-L-alanine amidase [Humidesulfovibrio sp.]
MAKAVYGCAGRGGRRTIWLLALLLSALCLLAPGSVLAARASSAKTVAKTVEDPADAPVRRFQTLLTRKNPSKDALRKLETELERAKTVRPDGPNGAKATFFLARVQQEIAKLTSRLTDWAKAADSFGACAEGFPKYQLAPDALMHRGLLRLERLGDPEGAQADFKSLRRTYPRSPLAAKAAKLERLAAQKAPSGAKKNVSVRESQPDLAAVQRDAPADKPQLLEIRPKNHSASARIVLDLDSPVKYRYRLLEQRGGKGSAGRIYVDLLGAGTREGLAEDTRVSGGILQHIRVASKGPDAMRVVMEFSEVKDCRVTVLEAPFRLVIDAFSSTKAKDLTPPPVAAQDDAPKKSFASPVGDRKKLAANLVEQLGLSVRTIMVDAGHGGKDPGAQGFGLQEKDITLRMAFVLGKILKQRGYRVLYTRTTDDFLSLEERTALANTNKADLFVSVHCNANTDPGIHGLETYSLNLARTPDEVRVAARENSVTDKNISDLQMILTDLMLTSKIKESVDLARGVQHKGLTALRTRWTVADHGNREAPFYVLMGAKMPSVLVEMGYITNKTEAARLKVDAYLRILANGIADGIGEYKQQIEHYTVK